MGTDDKLLAATHAMLRVSTTDDDRVWLCDVGFGSGPLEPIELIPNDREFAIGAWRFRLERGTDELGGELWTLHHFNRDGWLLRRTVAMNPQYRIDNVVGNHYVSTSRHSPFTMRPVLQRIHPDVHYMLDGTTLITGYPDGTGDTRELERAEIPKLLTEIFDIELDEADITELVQESWPADNDEPARSTVP